MSTSPSAPSLQTVARRVRAHVRAAQRRNLTGGYVATDRAGEGGAYYTQGARPSGVLLWPVDRLPSTATVAAVLEAE